MSLEPLDSEYSYKEMKEALVKGDIDNILNRYDYLMNVEGIPDPEAKRAIMNEFGSNLEVNSFSNMNSPDWKPNLDVGNGFIPDLTMKVFDTGYPPIPPLPVFANTSPFGNDGFDHKNPDPQGYAGGRDVENLSQYKTNAPENLVTKSQPYPYEDQSKENYVNAPFDPPSNPSMHGEHGFNVEKSIPEWKYPIEDDQGGVAELIVDRDKKTGQWVKHGTTKGDLITDHSLAPILDRARRDYLQRQWDGTIEEPHMVTDKPEDEEDPHAVVEALDLDQPIWAKYHVGPAHRDMDVCDKFKGKVYDLVDLNRPIPPSEGLGYTTTHPNCQCWWQPIKEPSKTTMATKPQRKEFAKIKSHITRKANKGKLHTVKPDGTLSNRTRKSNPMRETIEEIREQFQWLTDKYLDRIQTIDAPGKMFLIRASNEAITDHRTEGEPLRRWLSPDELHSMARTAIGKGMDVNHHPEYSTNAQVLDSEYDRNRHEIQMIINEQDPQILDAINKQIITAVSINGGAPRNESVECPDCETGNNCECFIVPEGVVLGEQDNIALTWVVTDPRGLNYHGMFIPMATPGVKTTAIQPL